MADFHDGYREDRGRMISIPDFKFFQRTSNDGWSRGVDNANFRERTHAEEGKRGRGGKYSSFSVPVDPIFDKLAAAIDFAFAAHPQIFLSSVYLEQLWNRG